MPELIAETPLAGLDVVHGAARLVEAPPAALWLFAPFPGRDADAAQALGAPLPAPGTTARAGAVALRWAGRAQVLLVGAPGWRPDPALGAHGGLTDVSDVHARLALSGRSAAEVLARLVPLDLRPARFPAGRTAKTLLDHVAAQVTATETGPDTCLEVMVMRSYARSAAHEIETAMRRVAARP